ncbi:hypothetical protein [Reinekea sp. G2M2-21]|uniref:hypothetical protein n=1 Tax=Reinekea sp. G2M2-21 TaxID=2788942 RepID=UPI0018A8CB7A|nr:hypothetical protein [Reinekea sp. G2M2-21]
MLAEPLTFFGYAYDPSTNQLLYTEVHRLYLDDDLKPLREEVDYIAANGNLLGQKKLRYENMRAPSYSVEFTEPQRAEKVAVLPNQLSIEARKSKNLPTPEGLFAVDAGFHYTILSQFEVLLTSQPVSFEFLNASRASFIEMYIEPKTIDEQTMTLELKLNNILFAQLVKPIVLTYDRHTQQLLRYEGLTNVPSPSGKNYQATIIYEYPENLSFAHLTY